MSGAPLGARLRTVPKTVGFLALLQLALPLNLAVTAMGVVRGRLRARGPTPSRAIRGRS